MSLLLLEKLEIYLYENSKIFSTTYKKISVSCKLHYFIHVVPTRNQIFHFKENFSLIANIYSKSKSLRVTSFKNSLTGGNGFFVFMELNAQ